MFAWQSVVYNGTELASAPKTVAPGAVTVDKSVFAMSNLNSKQNLPK